MAGYESVTMGFVGLDFVDQPERNRSEKNSLQKGEKRTAWRDELLLRILSIVNLFSGDCIEAFRCG